MQNYPFLKCLNPVLIRHNSQAKFVKCGKCLSCLNNRGSEMARLCELEMLGEYNVCYFVTLTYNNNTIPTFRLQKLDNSLYRVYDECRRSDTYSKNLVEFCNPELNLPGVHLDNKTLSLLESKNIYFNHDGEIRGSYLLYSDVQNFLKRLRKSYSKFIGNETKLRYFIVGEYGPKSLRAHWHLLLFVKQKSPKFFCEKNLHKIWKFGRVDIDLSKGGCANYSASYVSSSLSLPYLYKVIKKQTIARHSIKLGYSYLFNYYYSEFFEKINSSTAFYEHGPLKISYISGGAPRSLNISYLSKTQLFKLPYNFQSIRVNKSFLQYLRAYSHYSTLFSDVVYTSTKSLSEHVFDYLLSSRVNDYDLFIKSYLDIDNFCLCDTELYKKTFSRFLRFMYFSKKFISRCFVDPLYPKRLLDYLSYLDQSSLSKMYILQSENSLSKNPLSVNLFYDNYNSLETLSLLKSSPLYVSYFNEQVNIYKSKVLRKKMNDILGVLS